MEEVTTSAPHWSIIAALVIMTGCSFLSFLLNVINTWRIWMLQNSQKSSKESSDKVIKELTETLKEINKSLINNQLEHGKMMSMIQSQKG